MSKYTFYMLLFVLGILSIGILIQFTQTNAFRQTYSYLHRSTYKKFKSTTPDLNNDPRDAAFYNIILEEEALSFKPCTDIRLAASTKLSSVLIKGRKNFTYNIGDEIVVLVELKDGYGDSIKSGGDHLRATIRNSNVKASAPCVVTDNRNGTHYVTCEALWSGISTINVNLAYTRQAISAYYRMRREVLATRVIHGLFVNGSYEEDVACHPNHTHLLMFTNYTRLCNFTDLNSGMQFYCGKPRDQHLLCPHWRTVRINHPYPDLPLTKCENDLLMRGQVMLNKKLFVKVETGDENRFTIDKSQNPCSSYNLTQLWQSRKPTGYFYEGKWILRNCLGFNQNMHKKCLKNRHLYLFGDSTTRQWYSSITKRFNCKQITETWQWKKWHRFSECYNKELNFTAGWYPHAHPFYTGKRWADARHNLKSTSMYLDNIPQNEHAIVVIYFFTHLVSFHHNVFRERIQLIRQSIQRLLLRNEYSVVMIKAPHTFRTTIAGHVRLCDYYGFVYSKIMYEIFEGLLDRVVLLNNKDATIAKHEQWSHPSEDVVNYMIDQMLSYAC